MESWALRNPLSMNYFDSHVDDKTFYDDVSSTHRIRLESKGQGGTEVFCRGDILNRTWRVKLVFQLESSNVMAECSKKRNNDPKPAGSIGPVTSDQCEF